MGSSGVDIVQGVGCSKWVPWVFLFGRSHPREVFLWLPFEIVQGLQTDKQAGMRGHVVAYVSGNNGI